MTFYNEPDEIMNHHHKIYNIMNSGSCLLPKKDAKSNISSRLFPAMLVVDPLTDLFELNKYSG